jgi:hypothetical protein
MQRRTFRTYACLRFHRWRFNDALEFRVHWPMLVKLQNYCELEDDKNHWLSFFDPPKVSIFPLSDFAEIFRDENSVGKVCGNWLKFEIFKLRKTLSPTCLQLFTETREYRWLDLDQTWQADYSREIFAESQNFACLKKWLEFGEPNSVIQGMQATSANYIEAIDQFNE